MATLRYVFKDRVFRKYYGDPAHVGTVELYVDWEKLIQELGRKAALNKTGRSGLNIGIKAKFTPKVQS